MLASVFTKSIRDRQIATLVGVIGVVMIAVLGLGAYADLDDQIGELYGALPEAFLAVAGLTMVSDAGTLILGEIANLMAPLVFAGLAISMGSAAVAGEERRGTFGILLGNPKSRQSVVVSKAAAMIVLTTVGAALSGFGAVVTAGAFGTDTSTMHVAAAMTHVVVISLFFGFLALSVGSWTGNSSVALGTSAGVLLISFLAAGLLPLVESLADVARIFPWYYFNASSPLMNGIDWGHLTVLLTAILILGAGAVIGVRRRDLKVGTPSGALLNRLRGHPLGEKVLSRIAGQANVSRIAFKSVTDHKTLTVIAGIVILYTGLLVGPMYNGISEALVDFSAAIPEGLRAMIGGVDMATPEGWYTVEVFSITVPAAVIAVGASMGGRALAGEEEDHTMDLLLANPVKRSRVVLEKAVSLAVVAVALGTATFFGVWAGSLIGQLGISVVNIAATSMLAALLGVLFGYLSLAVSGGTGSRRTATLVTAGAGLAAYFANAFLSLNEQLAGWARLSPFYYYANGDPLAQGIIWSHPIALVAMSLVTLTVAVQLFQRRDLRG